MTVGFKLVSSILLALICLPAVAADKYLFIAGTAFAPQSSSQPLDYVNSGCAYSNGDITTSVNLPKNATIKAVRLYYKNNVSAKRVTIYLTRYDQLGGHLDLLNAPSSLASGFHNEDFQLNTPEVINNEQNSYSLIARMTPSIANRPQLCGARVKYSAP